MQIQKIFLFGIDNAGKTSLSQALRTGEANPDNLPTKAFNVMDLFLKSFDKNTEFKIWDAPGQVTFRRTWGRGMDAANLMVFVLDVADKNRYGEAKQVFQAVTSDLETRSVPLIFLFHKMDLPEAKNNFGDAQKFFKPALVLDRKLYLLQTSVKDPKTIAELKKTIGTIVQESRWG